MATNNSEYKQHISIAERNKWNKVVVDFSAHLGSGGVDNHRLGDGATPGFSTNDFTNEYREKLENIQAGALNNPHPAKHSWSEIDGMSTVGHTGRYGDLLEIPNEFKAGSGNCDTVGGINFFIQSNTPSNPVANKTIWFDTGNKLIKYYSGSAWVPFGAVYL